MALYISEAVVNDDDDEELVVVVMARTRQREANNDDDGGELVISEAGRLPKTAAVLVLEAPGDRIKAAACKKDAFIILLTRCG
jgi:hypothetical protein